jgi:hypothetical protein
MLDDRAGVGTKCKEKLGASLLLLLQVAQSPALPASATIRTTGAGSEIVDTARRENAGGDASNDDADT